VHVWRVFIPEAPIADLALTLSVDERARAARFAYEKDRNQFIAIRGWLRILLGTYLHRPPAEIRFQYGAQGKPLLADSEKDPDLHFNVSHSAALGALAFCRGREIGVDVELMERRFDILDLARSCFSSGEQESLLNCPEDENLERFFQLWTSKEAYIKALGGGLSIPLQDFSVGVRSDSDNWSVVASGAKVPDNADAPLMVRRLTVPESYAGAVAATGNDWSVQTHDVTSDHLQM
jgi:4'-phosphopantetheinyl transferase